MARSLRRESWLVGILALVGVLGTAGPAYASCAEPVPLEEAIGGAHAVFVGTVTGLEHDDRVATFRVGEIWKGDAGSSVRVNGGPSLDEIDQAAGDGLAVVTSVDRTYVIGETYLVVAHGAEGDVLRDNVCSATQVYDTALEQFRPIPQGSPPPPQSGGAGLAPDAQAVVAVIGAGVVITAVATATRRVMQRRACGPVGS